LLARDNPPDLVLSDVMMPRMDGFALLRHLRADPRTREIPVVLLSARAGEESLLEGIETGADDYLIKPFSSRELIARVQTHLGMAQLRRKWTRELEHANQELEAFSYSVSHDLRTPLRAIDGFSKALLARCNGKLDEVERDYLGRARAATQRMDLLIDDLLNLSRIARTALHRERIDVSSLAEGILSDLAQQEPDRRIERRIAPGLVAHADPRLTAVLLENLLGNAWKYTAKQPEAVIEVDKRVGDDGTEAFIVSDNGAGFAMEHAGKLFTPFHRLHSEAEFAGTGIGLATVRRIVARHGGRVWATAAPDRGATFFFSFEGSP